MSERITTTVDDVLAQRIREVAGDNVSGWLAIAAREKLDRDTAAAYERWDETLSETARPELAEWNAMPLPRNAA